MIDPLAFFSGFPPVLDAVFAQFHLPDAENCRLVCSAWREFVDSGPLHPRNRARMRKKYLRHCWLEKKLRGPKEMKEVSDQEWSSLVIRDVTVHGRDALVKLNCAKGGMDHREVVYFYRDGVFKRAFDAQQIKCKFSYRLMAGMTERFIVLKPDSNLIYLYDKDNGELIRKFTPGQDETIRCLEVGNLYLTNGLRVVTACDILVGLILVYTYSDLSSADETPASSRMVINLLRQELPPMLAADTTLGTALFRSTPSYLFIHTRHGVWPDWHRTVAFDYDRGEVTAEVSSDPKSLSLMTGCRLALVNDIGRGFSVIDLATGDVLESRGAKDGVKNVAFFSRSAVAFSCKAQGGNDTEYRLWSQKKKGGEGSLRDVEPGSELGRLLARQDKKPHVISEELGLFVIRDQQGDKERAYCIVHDLSSGVQREVDLRVAAEAPSVRQVVFSEDGFDVFFIARMESCDSHLTCYHAKF